MNICAFFNKAVNRLALLLTLFPLFLALPAWSLSAFTQINAAAFNSQSGTQLENSTEGGQNVAFIDSGDFVSYNQIDFATGAATFSARVASNNNGGIIEIRSDTVGGARAGTCAVPKTGGWQTWVTVSCSVTGLSGIHTLYLKFSGGAGNLFNIRWFSFTAPGISAFNQIEAENYSSQSGIQTEVSSEAGRNVGWIENGDYIAFQNMDFQTGAQSLTARVASAGIGGNIEVHLDNISGPLAGTCAVPVTGGWQTWINVNCGMSGVTGIHTVYLKFIGGSGALFNINWFAFSKTPVQSTGGDVVGKIFAGYQGWFNARGDNSPFGCWFHWSNNCDAPTPNTNVKFELYPDTREYSKLYQSNLANLANGRPASLFSSYDQQTVNKHFEWMQAYRIDGAALQRFGADESDVTSGYKSNRDAVAINVKNAAEAYSRKFYVMYDITGLNANWATAIKHDWSTNVVNKLQLTFSSSYARQNNKLVVCIWGLGFTHTPGTPAETAELIAWFKTQNVYVIGGVPTYWRTGINDSKPGFLDAFKTLDMISPWLVGRFGGIDGADNFKNNLWAADFAFTQANKIIYQPVIWPGFAWSNMYPNNPRNQIPRLHGDFMWRQAYNMKKLGINTGYIAMFDEYDEGTAIAKAAENASMAPTNQYFLTLDADGVAVSADFYLRLSGDITRMFKDEISATEQHPTPHF